MGTKNLVSLSELRYKKGVVNLNLSLDEVMPKKKRNIRKEMIKGYMALLSK